MEGKGLQERLSPDEDPDFYVRTLAATWGHLDLVQDWLQHHTHEPGKVTENVLFPAAMYGQLEVLDLAIPFGKWSSIHCPWVDGPQCRFFCFNVSYPVKNDHACIVRRQQYLYPVHRLWNFHHGFTIDHMVKSSHWWYKHGLPVQCMLPPFTEAPPTHNMLHNHKHLVIWYSSLQQPFYYC